MRSARTQRYHGYMSRPGRDRDAPRLGVADASEWAERLQFERWRAMSVEEKVRIARDLNAALHRVSLAGLRQRFPSDSAEDLEYRAACSRNGRELMERLTGKRLPW